MKKSWHLNRRTFLRGAGAALALPMLDCMGASAAKSAATELPRRMCAVYFPFGVSLPKEGSEDAKWNWFPRGEGKDFQFTNTLQPLAPVKDDVTVIGGLSHPTGWKMGGHDTGDIFLTAAAFQGSRYQNSVSIDQLAAAAMGHQTRFPSLTLSSDGGVGEPTRSTTLSFSRRGRPIPAMANPQQIFERLFGQGGAGSAGDRRTRLQNTESMLDSVLADARSLKGKLGTQDRKKFDEYLASVRAIEQRVARSQRWLDIPKPKVDASSIALESTQDDPKEYIRTMYDLMFLSFQTDSTRIATYMIGQVAGATSIANAFPACLGLAGNWHGLAHGAGKKGGAEKLGRFDQFLVEQLAYFLDRLKNTSEGDGNLLDRTMVLYGSSNSRTHNNHNYPLVLAGGRKLGFKHGQYVKHREQFPLSNLFVTMLQRMNLPVEQFADSTGEMTELLT